MQKKRGARVYTGKITLRDKQQYYFTLKAETEEEVNTLMEIHFDVSKGLFLSLTNKHGLTLVPSERVHFLCNREDIVSVSLSRNANQHEKKPKKAK